MSRASEYVVIWCKAISANNESDEVWAAGDGEEGEGRSSIATNVGIIGMQQSGEGNAVRMKGGGANSDSFFSLSAVASLIRTEELLQSLTHAFRPFGRKVCG